MYQNLLRVTCTREYVIEHLNRSIPYYPFLWINFYVVFFFVLHVHAFWITWIHCPHSLAPPVCFIHSKHLKPNPFRTCCPEIVHNFYIYVIFLFPQIIRQKLYERFHGTNWYTETLNSIILFTIMYSSCLIAFHECAVFEIAFHDSRLLIFHGHCVTPLHQSEYSYNVR